MGVSSSEEIARALIPIEDVMRAPPVTVAFDSMVMDAVKAMIDMNIGSVVVLNEDGQFCGIVTERDVLERVIGEGRSPQETQVNEVMTSPVIAVESNISLREALKLMRDHNVRRLAVTNEDELEGQVTERRVLDALIFISKLD
jgi:signal-transduction protein with cAMP-binding, CBS, and nucleotidyltransferase domain